MISGHHGQLAAFFVLAALVLAAVAGWNSRLSVGVLVLLSVAWAGVDSVFDEGPTLFPITHFHGVTVADLPGVAGLVVALFLIRRHWRRR